MTITLASTAKAAMMAALNTLIDNGTLEFTDASNVVLATHGLASPAGTLVGSTLTLALDTSSVNASATGTVALARIKDSGGTIQVSGISVGTSGTDIIVSTTAFVNGVPITKTADLALTI